MRPPNLWSVLSCLLPATLLLAGCDSGGSTTPDPVLFTITVDLSGDGTGTVTSAPAGLMCTSADGTCTAQFEEGTAVTLTAAPDEGAEFSGWGDACSGAETCALTVTADATISAAFGALPAYTVTVYWVGDGSGHVTSDPAGLDCASGEHCEADFFQGTALTLTATPEDGSTFVTWDGYCSGDGACEITVDGDRPVSAEFNDPAVTSQTVGPGGNVVASEDGGLTLAVPAGALSESTTLTVRRLDPEDLPEGLQDLEADPGILAAYELGPDGLTFDVPVLAAMGTGVTPELGPLEAEGRVLVQWNESGLDLPSDQMPVLDPATGELLARGTIEHFSVLVATDMAYRATVTVPDAVEVGDAFSVAWSMMLDGWETGVVEPTRAEYNDHSSAPLEAGTAQGVEGGFGSQVPYTCNAETDAQGADFAATIRLFAYLKNDAGNVIKGVTLATPRFMQQIRCDAPAPRTLRVLWDGLGSGHVTSAPAGIDCASGTDCSAMFDKGTEVTLTATADEGFEFCGWSGGNGAMESNPSVKVTLDSDGSATACFRLPPQKIRMRLDYEDIDAEGGTISEGRQAIDLLDKSQFKVGVRVVLGQVAMDVAGNNWRVSANGTDEDHVGGTPGDPLSFILGESTLPGSVALSDYNFALKWAGNNEPQPVKCQTRNKDGDVVDERTLTFPNGWGKCQAGWRVDLLSLEGFATFHVRMSYYEDAQ